MNCQYCEGDISPPEKPYISKQAHMEGTYHWGCFVEACRNRMPVGAGVISIPGFNPDEEESSKRPLATAED